MQKYGSFDKKLILAQKKIQKIHPTTSSIYKPVYSAFKKKFLSTYKKWRKLSSDCYSQQLPIDAETVTNIL